VAVSLASLVSILAAILARQGWPLLGLILSVPLTGGFLFLDSRRVSRWCEEIQRMCQSDGLDYALFEKTILGFRHLPTRSLHGMLAAFPGTAAQEASSLTSPSRPGRGRTDILLQTFLLTAALCTLAGAALFRSVAWLAGACGVVLVFLVLGRRS
jgi:hypothetical protein